MNSLSTPDDRSPDFRAAQLEISVARLEERNVSDRENREAWRGETLRRLDALNNISAHYAAQATLDRERYMTRESWESRHAELRTEMQTGFREATLKQAEHERDRTREHAAQGEKIGALEQFKANIQGRLIATAALSAIITALAGLILKLFSK